MVIWRVKGRRGARNLQHAPVSTRCAKRVRTNYFKIHFKISYLRRMARSVTEGLKVAFVLRNLITSALILASLEHPHLTFFAVLLEMAQRMRADVCIGGEGKAI